MRRRLHALGRRVGLRRYCELCDGSFREARARGRDFHAERWPHWRHERHRNADGTQGALR